MIKLYAALIEIKPFPSENIRSLMLDKFRASVANKKKKFKPQFALSTNYKYK